MGLFNLSKHPLTNVSIGTIEIARQFIENGVEFAHTLAPFFANKAALYKLHVSSMRHGHG
jgi:hypothetical protein